jgi:hypothetical protein
VTKTKKKAPEASETPDARESVNTQKSSQEPGNGSELANSQVVHVPTANLQKRKEALEAYIPTLELRMRTHLTKADKLLDTIEAAQRELTQITRLIASVED